MHYRNTYKCSGLKRANMRLNESKLHGVYRAKEPFATKSLTTFFMQCRAVPQQWFKAYISS